MPDPSFDLKSRLKHAVALHQAGQLSAAAQAYEQILEQTPDHSGVLQLRANVALQMGDPAHAIALMNGVIARDPAASAAFALRADAWNAFKHHEKALADLSYAVALKPGDAKLLKGRGDTFYALGRFAEALADYDGAVAANPEFAAALHHRGNALRQLGRLEEALAAYQAAIARDPSDAEVRANCAIVLLALGRGEDALREAEQALVCDPNSASAYSSRGAACFTLRRFGDAADAYLMAARLAPDAKHANDAGLALLSASRRQEALASYEQAIARDPNHVAARRSRAEILLLLGRHEEGMRALTELIAHHPDSEFAKSILLFTKMQLCDWSDFDASVADIVGDLAAGRRVASPFYLLLALDDPALQKRAAELWPMAQISVDDPVFATQSREKIRVGYFSSDFRDHAMGNLTADMFERHDKARFEVSGYALGPPDDSELRRRLLSSFDRFVEIDALSDVAAAALARTHGLDIAIDLNGYTEHARSGIFAHRAAPIQVNYIGYPGTMGAPYIDYIIGDPIVTPPGAEIHYTENIVALPHTYLPDQSRRIVAAQAVTRAEAGLPAQGFVFCSFNLCRKITPRLFDAWMRILRQVEGSVLWLLEPAPPTVANLRAAAAERGVNPERLIFAGRVGKSIHLARHRLIDLFLDTMPYNSHTTASDALRMGVPLLTCLGQSFAARVAASLLTAVLMPDLITESLEAYEELAISLARDPAKLAAIRRRLQENLSTAPLFDPTRMTKHLEQAYETMVMRHRQGLAPAHIRLDPL